MKIPRIEGRRSKNAGVSRTVAGGFVCMCCNDYYPLWSCVTKSDFYHPNNNDILYSICAYCICDLNDNGFDCRERIMDYLKSDEEVSYYDLVNKKFGNNKDNLVELQPDNKPFLRNLFK